MMFARVLASVCFVAALTALAGLSAAAYSSAIKGACKADYKRFCRVYAVNDPGLRKCMDKAGRSLSTRCVKTLVESGEITKERATQRWRHKLD